MGMSAKSPYISPLAKWEGANPGRRGFLAAIATLACAPAWAHYPARRSGPAVDLAATWQLGNGYQVGALAVHDRLVVRAALDVPTRAHGLLLEPVGTLLTVARRPGDWLLRWDRQGKAIAWRWIEPRRAFAGHVLASADGRFLYTTELDLDAGTGLIGVRAAASLEKLAEWPTHGMDPHMLTWDRTRPGALLVANGGVPTQPETGRVKRDLERMDSSVVRLDGHSGELVGQWRLDDPRLSLRHVAWGGSRDKPLLGIALQAEHDRMEDKTAAPVFSLFDGVSLRACSAPQSLAGYGGDVAALPGPDGGVRFAVSCPRAQGVSLYGTNGAWQGLVPLAEACPLATDAGRLWAGGGARVLGLATDKASSAGMEIDLVAAVDGPRLDNHWIVLDPT